jgi:periplasmic protein TonB
MGARDNAQSAGLLEAGARTPTAKSNSERRFWIGLSCAALLHATLIIGISRSSSLHRMGEKEGRPDGISVELIDAADLLSKSSVPLDGGTTPPSAASPPAPPTPPPQPPQPAPQQPAPTPRPEAARPAKPAPEPQKAPQSASREPIPDLFALPDVMGKQSAPPPEKSQKASPKADPQTRTSTADPTIFVPESAGVSRPAGVTRSGENDEFGRGVIRALRQTMPPPRGSNGRVTVRLLLSENGNLAEVSIVRSAGDPILDQSVVFAVKQSNFPIPPGGSTTIDRTFLVTYIYR